MYAVVDIAGKQFKVSQAQRLVVPKLLAEPGEVLTFERVLLLARSPDGAGKVTTDSVGIKVGTPTVQGAKVQATVLSHVKGEKVIVFKKKRRKGYRVKRGHRQGYTEIRIDAIEA